LDSNNSAPHSSILHQARRCRRLRYKNFSSFSSFQELKKNETSSNHKSVRSLSVKDASSSNSCTLRYLVASVSRHLVCIITQFTHFIRQYAHSMRSLLYDDFSRREVSCQPYFLLSCNNSPLSCSIGAMHCVYERRSVKKKMKI
jgi:hypothetical protein